MFENKVMKESWAWMLKLVLRREEWSEENAGAGGCSGEVGVRRWNELIDWGAVVQMEMKESL